MHEAKVVLLDAVVGPLALIVDEMKKVVAPKEIL